MYPSGWYPASIRSISKSARIFLSEGELSDPKVKSDIKSAQPVSSVMGSIRISSLIFHLRTFGVTRELVGNDSFGTHKL